MMRLPWSRSTRAWPRSSEDETKRVGFATSNEVVVAVVGAHLSGMPLNSELLALGARLVEKTVTTGDYKLYELADAHPPKPGLLRVPPGQGSAIEVETWQMAVEDFGRFVALVKPPLSIGTLTLTGGREVKGFLVEAVAVAQARDISSFGGWRAFIRNRQNASA
jgi:allophanate hydrolase